MLKTIFAAFAPKPSSNSAAGRQPPGDSYRWGLEQLDADNLLHSLYMGSSQTGKSTLMTMAMQDLLPLVRTRENTRGFCYDPKGDLHAILAAPQYGFTDQLIKANPFLVGSRSWLMYRDINSPQRAQECTEGLVQKEAAKDGQESFFSITVKDVAKAVMCGLMRKGVPWGLRDLLLAMTNDAALNALLLPHYDTAKTLRLALYQREDTAKDIRSSINNLFNRFSSVAALWHAADRERRGFSISEWASSNQIIVLPGASGDGDPIKVITQVLFDQIAIRILTGAEARDVDPAPRIFGFVDELRRAGYLSRLKDLLFLAASKGLRLYLGAQGIEGLRAVFGNDEASELTSLCANKALLRTHGSESAEWMAKQIHSQLVMEDEYSVNIGSGTETRSKTTRRVSRDLVEPMRFLHFNTPQLNGNLEAIFIAPELRSKGREVFWRRIPAERLYAREKGLIWPKGSLCELEQRPPEQQILRPWDVADIQRLQLPPTVLAEQSQQSRFSSISYKLFGD